MSSPSRNWNNCTSSKTRISYLIIGIAVALVIGGFLFSSNFKTKRNTVEVMPNTLELKFASLSKAETNRCSVSNFIYSMDANERLQGSCCSPMDFHKYTEQIEGLKKYSYIDKIPSDPYDIPVSLPKELLGYQKSIQLTSEQQFVYNGAIKLSHEGGPCCCKCWRWDAFEGLAKYLITEYNFNAEQIAEVWNLIDGCGGEGHVDGAHRNN